MSEFKKGNSSSNMKSQSEYQEDKEERLSKQSLNNKLDQGGEEEEEDQKVSSQQFQQGEDYYNNEEQDQEQYDQQYQEDEDNQDLDNGNSQQSLPQSGELKQSKQNSNNNFTTPKYSSNIQEKSQPNKSKSSVGQSNQNKSIVNLNQDNSAEMSKLNSSIVKSQQLSSQLNNVLDKQLSSQLNNVLDKSNLKNSVNQNQNLGGQQQVQQNVSAKQNEAQPKEKINVEEIVLKCNIHRQDIVKVCGRKECKEKMLFCLECIEEFAEHVVKHRPFIPINQFLSELQDNPHTSRKEKIEKLQKENSQFVHKFLQQANAEKTRVAQKVIPVLKSALIGLCDQLQSRISDEIDQFSNIYQYNSSYLTSYLDQQGLLTEILDQVPSFGNIYQKYEENQGSKESDFHDYLEKVYRRILNNSSVEQTKQAFSYFEELFDNFRKQGEKAPVFIGEAQLLEKVEQAFQQFLDNSDLRYSSIVSQYPVCSSCSKEVDSESSSQQIQIKLKQLENKLKDIQKGGSQIPSSSSSNKKDSISFAQQTTPVSKVGALINSKTEDIKSIQKEIERLQKSKPGSCKGCRRLYCINCQDQSFCKGCKIVFDPNLKTSKFVIKESKGFQVAMLDDTSKQSVIGSMQGTNYRQSFKLQQISTQLKKLNVALMLADQELYSGKYEWEVIIENFGQCHSMGFGLCKLDDLKNDLSLNKDFKELSDKTSLILVTSNGTISGGLKGRIQSFQKEKNAMAFNCLLDFGKNKFFIQGKNVYLERDLENNQGYTPCFYSGCCFKSYNNFVLKQKYQYDPIVLQK